MTPEEAFDNLTKYYEEDDHHDYIRESWQTLKLIVLAAQTNNSSKPEIPIYRDETY